MLAEIYQKALANIETVLVGKSEVIGLCLKTFFAGGHVLLEDVPGVGKTVLARSLAVTLGGSFARVQCTADLMPTDIIGVEIYSQKQEAFSFRKGPVHHNVVLADELNRATPKAQAALLESMAERQVSYNGKTYRLPEPFFVIATQNPIEQSGTYPLPEAQLDRFGVRLSMGYPDPSQEEEMLTRLSGAHPLAKLEKIAQEFDMKAIASEISKVYVDAKIKKYLVTLANKTRNSESLQLGVSPRALLVALDVARVSSACEGKDFVGIDTIQKVLPYTWGHRVIKSGPLGVREGYQEIEAVISQVPIPHE